jgi:Sugar phosphate permease
MAQGIFSKNFLLLVMGQVSSLFGNYILRFALSMYVLEETGSAAIYAGILALAAIPAILLSPLGGMIADRANRRNIMVTLDILSGLCILCAMLLFSDSNGIKIISLLLIVLSILATFETPAVQACIPQMLTGYNLIKGNAVVNQVAAAAALIAPIFGSVFYVTFHLKPVLAASLVCFFLTALFERLIELPYIPSDNRMKVLLMIRKDFSVGMRFICKEQPEINKMLLLIAVVNFFVIGSTMVGLPYIVRTVLDLNAKYYGTAESALGLAAILGGITAAFLTNKMRISHLSMILAELGLFLIPAGGIFLTSASIQVKYYINLAAFCSLQIASCIFSVFALSLIQQKTPNHLTGKVMAYTSMITMCAQPLGQTVYGVLFDWLSSSVYLILIPSGVILLLIGLFTTQFFKKLNYDNKDCYGILK